MKYRHFDELKDLVARRLVSKRDHETLPLSIYNYTAAAQHLPIPEWTEALKDCRGLILNADGEIIGRPFRKFWNYEQMQSEIPAGESFTVWEKCDGSLGIVCNYDGLRVVATRGSFYSDQAVWAEQWFQHRLPGYRPTEGLTHLFEIIYPENRIVVDYRGWSGVVLLAVLDSSANDRWDVFDRLVFKKARRYDGLTGFSDINSNPDFEGQEGFVVQWASGLRVKVKLEEYKRLHRLVTQCSTRTIWELLRTGSDTAELLDRVPSDFYHWASNQIQSLTFSHASIIHWAHDTFRAAPPWETRKEFADYAKRQQYPSLLFSLLDGKDITDAAWKLVEPKLASQFRKDTE